MRTVILLFFTSILSLFISGTCKQPSPVFSFKKRIEDDTAKKLFVLSTDYISWGDVVPMLKAYKTNSNALRAIQPNGSKAVLEGLQLDADYVRGMLSDPTIRKIELFFAVNKSDLLKPGNEQTFTIVTAPVYFDMAKKVYSVKKYRDLAGSRTEAANSELIDFCDPCPKNCPDTTQN